MFKLLLPTKFWAKLTMVIMRACWKETRGSVFRPSTYPAQRGQEGCAHLAVVVGRHLCHRTSQLSHLHLPLVVPLQAGEQHLPLARF